jgi:hypothetical protein
MSYNISIPRTNIYSFLFVNESFGCKCLQSLGAAAVAIKPPTFKISGHQVESST